MNSERLHQIVDRLLVAASALGLVAVLLWLLSL